MDAKELALIKQLIEVQASEDNRLTESQKGVMRQMIEQGVNEHEAKMRVMCIGETPDHMKPVPPSTDLYPRAVYHPDGRIKSAKDELDYKAAKKAGWEDKPSQIHLDVTLAADIRRQQMPGGAATFVPPRAN